MNPTHPSHPTPWTEFLASQPPLAPQATPGSTSASASLIPLDHLAVISIAGEDAKSFLHGQLTNDVNHLPVDALRHAAWCSAKGRMLASFLVWQGRGAAGSESGYRLALSADLAAAIAKRLKMFVLRAKVNVQEAVDTLLLGVAGPGAEALLQAVALPVPPAPMARAESNGVDVLRLENERFILALPQADVPDVWTRLLAAGAAAAPAEDWRRRDVAAGLVRICAATQEAFVPQMANFDRIGGVNFQKGCYPGQEIVARTQYLGKVKRHLYQGHADFPVQVGDALYSPEVPDQSCGQIAEAVADPAGGFQLLAVVQEGAAASARVGSVDGPALTRLELPAYMAEAS